jgi:hypothetical protein
MAKVRFGSASDIAAHPGGNFNDAQSIERRRRRIGPVRKLDITYENTRFNR